MPDFDDDDTEAFAAPDTGEDERFREMRKAANKASKLSKENAALASRLAEMERKVAFADAGLTLSDRQKTALLAAHGDTELTKDALLATAVELGFAQAPAEGDPVVEQALEGIARVTAATTGAPPAAAIAPIHQQIATAEQAGDWDTAGLLKAQLVAQAARSGASSVSFA